MKDFAKQIGNILHSNIHVHGRRLIADLPGNIIKFIEKPQSHCYNMKFSDKSRYEKKFQQVTHKGGESAMNYIKLFQHTKALSVSVENTYPEDQLMHKFLDNIHQSLKHPVQIAINQSELMREG